MTPFDNVYRSRRVFLTGHTGFKGSWLAAWLSQLGAEVTGFALPPATAPNHWDLLRLPVRDCRGDIRDTAALSAAMRESDPEIVFHLAAQPLVRRSYADPLETWSTNVMGTANVLESCRSLRSLKAIVIVTTDKVYFNNETSRGYREDDRLGGHDPYSASKAASELVVESYRQSFFSDPTSPINRDSSGRKCDWWRRLVKRPADSRYHARGSAGKFSGSTFSAGSPGMAARAGLLIRLPCSRQEAASRST